ncbi:galactose-3-O-sulfotransferase 3 [Menidia menidia]
MTRQRMMQKKIFLVLVVICTASLLLHHGGFFSWTAETFPLGCPALRPPKPKHTNVVFLKTHKTASTTTQNLLFRFAERYNLTVALPVQACGHQFCYPSSFRAQLVHPHTLPANLLTSHTRFNRSALRRLMPNDTVYITILREPAAMFESLFAYYSNHCQSFRRVPNGSLEAFLEEPLRYYRPQEKESMYARNTLTFDLGGDKDRPAADAGYAAAFAAEVERSFSLVMISEYFDESLVLLRHLLSWDLEDVVYVRHNMRTEGSRRSLTQNQRDRIRAWNGVDAHLYDHFNASLWRRIAALGPACVAREVRLLRKAQERLMRECFGRRTPVFRPAAEIQNKELRPWQPSEKVDIAGYSLPPNISRQAQELCLKHITPEVSYTRALLRSQSLRHRRTHQGRPPPSRGAGPPPPHPAIQGNQGNQGNQGDQGNQGNQGNQATHTQAS